MDSSELDFFTALGVPPAFDLGAAPAPDARAACRALLEVFCTRSDNSALLLDARDFPDP
jgi:hypothetical protein